MATQFYIAGITLSDLIDFNTIIFYNKFNFSSHGFGNGNSYGLTASNISLKSSGYDIKCYSIPFNAGI